MVPSFRNTNFNSLRSQEVLKDFDKLIYHGLVFGIAVGEEVQRIEKLAREFCHVVVEIQRLGGKVAEIVKITAEQADDIKETMSTQSAEMKVIEHV